MGQDPCVDGTTKQATKYTEFDRGYPISALHYTRCLFGVTMYRAEGLYTMKHSTWDDIGNDVTV